MPCFDSLIGEIGWLNWLVKLVGGGFDKFQATANFVNAPELSGSRAWPWFRECRKLWSLSIDYLDLKVLFDEDEVAMQNGREGEGDVAGSTKDAGSELRQRKEVEHGGGRSGTRAKTIYGYVKTPSARLHGCAADRASFVAQQRVARRPLPVGCVRACVRVCHQHMLIPARCPCMVLACVRACLRACMPLIRYHPHGIIPFTAGLVLLSDAWRKRHGKKPPIYMSDAFTHTMPLYVVAPLGFFFKKKT